MTKIKKISLLTLFTAILCCSGEGLHSPWNAQLQKYVKNGRVQYSAWAQDKKALDAYLGSLSSLGGKDIKAMPREEKMAFYINAYNAFMIKAVLDNPGIKSVQDIKPKIWTQEFVNLGGKSLSLDALENDILRPMFKDPRIHFGIVCASVSCPPLRSEAYTAENVEASLEDNLKAYLRNEKENYFTGPETKISKIFEWFPQDFKKFPGGLEGFLKNYAPATYDQSKPIIWADYNWGLNSR